MYAAEMMIFTAVVALLVAQPDWIGPPGRKFPGQAPAWVWVARRDDMPTVERAPEGAVWLGKEFEVANVLAGAEPNADICMAADNSAELFLDGVRLLESKSWSSVERKAISLSPGKHLLNVRAVNGEGGGRNPAGVIVVLAGRERSDIHVVSDESWRGQGTEWSGWPAAAPPAEAAPVVVLAPVGSQPWGLSVSAFEAQRPCPLLRREFTVNGLPTKATVRIVGLGHYELTCNGKRIGHTLLNQAWSQYDKTLYWQEFDLMPHVREGGNALGVLLGNSFWHVAAANDSGRFTKTDAMPNFSEGRDHLLWLEARITTPAGEQVVTSDKNWTWAEGPLTFSNVFAGEDYDARREQPNWDMPDPSNSGLKAVEILKPPPAKLAPLVGPGMQVFQTFSPVDVVQIDESTFTLSFEQNCSALLRFEVEGPAGATVRFKPCEYLGPDGRVKFTYTWGTGKDIWFDYTLRGGGIESHRTKFCYVGAQYVQVEGAVPAGFDNPRGLPVVKKLVLDHVRAACPEVGTFECSSGMHNGAFRLIDWSIRSNMAHFPTDCPHREKCLWIEQDWHMARALSYRFDVKDWYTKLCRDIRDTQLPDGHVPTNSPNYLVGVPPHGFWNEAAEWGIASVLVPWHLYEWYGDEAILRESYESMKRYLDYLEIKAKADGGLLKSNLGDWYDYGHGKGDGPSRWTPSEVSAMAVWSLGLRTVVETGRVLVSHEQSEERRDALARDMSRFMLLNESLQQAFRDKLYDAHTQTVKNNGSCQAGNAAALCAFLIPKPHRTDALNRIIEDLEKRDWQQTVGEVMQVFFVRALAEAGRNDVLHRVYARRERGGYGFMVEQGLTTLPESWDAKPGTGNSMNHFMLGHLMEWHFAYVAGIRQAPGSVGWRNVVIGPNPGIEHGVTSASATFQSPRGKIASTWEVKDGLFNLIVEVPEGVEASALLPDGTRQDLKAGRSSLSCPFR
jgi:alpha-L-rhamnosidase